MWLPEAPPAPPEPTRHSDGFVPEYENGIPVRLRWNPCLCDECETAWRALLAEPDELRRRLIAAAVPAGDHALQE